MILLQLNRPQMREGSSSPIFQMLQRTFFIPNSKAWVDVRDAEAGHGGQGKKFVC